VVRVDDGQRLDAAILHALDAAPTLVWSGAVAPWAWTPELDFWLAPLPGFCRVFLEGDAVTAGRVPRGKDSWGAWGVFSGGSLAYLTARQVGGTDAMPSLQVGACGFGPDGAALAEALVGRVTTWQRDTADGVEVTIQARAIDANLAVDEDGALLVAEKTDHIFVVTAVQRVAAVNA
jgi:protein-L-isoaspartate(D-aspartate) O-methyltransferase